MIHILIVEDEKPISNLIRMSLTKAGYSCMCAYDGEQALDMIKNNVYELILFDAIYQAYEAPGHLPYSKEYGRGQSKRP